MSNPGGCPPHVMIEVSRRPGGTDKHGKPLPDIVTKQCSKCGYTQ